MDEHKPLPQTADDKAWCHRRLAELAGLFAVCAKAADTEKEVDDLAKSMALCQLRIHTMSKQGVAAWQQYASEALTVIVEGGREDGGVDTRDPEYRARHKLYRSLALSMRAFEGRYQRRSN
jgi:hypothetical protein